VTLPTTSQALIRVTAHDAAGHATQDVSNAVFSITGRTLTVNVAPAGAGTVSRSPDLASYDNGASVQLTASAGAGWSFSAWSGAVTGSTNPVDVVMDADQTVTATFVDIGSPTVSVTAPNGGEVLVAGTHANITWTATDNVAVTTVDLELSRNGAAGPYTSIATGIANTGTFDWLVTLPTTSQALIRVTAHDAAGHATEDVSNAVFSITGRTLTVNVSPAGAGTVAKSPDQASYANGASVQLTASPGTGWSFSAWSGAVTGSTNPVDVVMDADQTATATFVDAGSPTVTLSTPNGGESLGIGVHHAVTWTAADNDSVNAVDLELSRNGAAGPFEPVATGIANTGTFDWLVTPPITSQAVVRVTAHDAAGHATQDLSNAVFSITGSALTVNVIPPGAGTVSRSPDQNGYATGTSVQLTANPGPGWSFSAWSGAVTGSTNPVDVVMDADKTVTATFADVAPPTVALKTPNGGENLGLGLHYSITWTMADNDTVNSVDLTLSRNGAAGPFEALITGLRNRSKFDWVVTTPATGHALVRITAHDPAGHTTQDLSDAEFTIAAGVGVDDSPVTAFALSPLWPNPVRGRARFEIALPRAAHVRLGVYDLQGRERLVLADGVFAAGVHAMDGGQFEAAGLGPGLYFLRMSVPGKTLVRRFLTMP
jgi:hypothetical protein